MAEAGHSDARRDAKASRPARPKAAKTNVDDSGTAATACRRRGGRPIFETTAALALLPKRLKATCLHRRYRSGRVFRKRVHS